jgi:hypothetical protein
MVVGQEWEREIVAIEPEREKGGRVSVEEERGGEQEIGNRQKQK